MLNLGPCAMLPPHYHPRASNYVVAVGGNTTTYMYEENGAELVTTNLQTGQATIFPQGSMHMMANTGKFPSLRARTIEAFRRASFLPWRHLLVPPPETTSDTGFQPVAEALVPPIPPTQSRHRNFAKVEPFR